MKSSLDYILTGLGVCVVAILAAGVMLQTTSRLLAVVVLLLIGAPGAVVTLIGTIGKGVEMGLKAARPAERPTE